MAWDAQSHAVLIHYMLNYTLSCCLDTLHAPLHSVLIHYTFHCKLVQSITWITCCRNPFHHYMACYILSQSITCCRNPLNGKIRSLKWYFFLCSCVCPFFHCLPVGNPRLEVMFLFVLFCLPFLSLIAYRKSAAWSDIFSFLLVMAPAGKCRVCCKRQVARNQQRAQRYLLMKQQRE